MRILGINLPRLTPGALWLRFRQKFGQGLRVAYYRDVVRPRILKTPPVRGTTDPVAEIHVLTSAEDWLNLIWTLKSFYSVSPRKLALCIHADKSLTAQTLAVLRHLFPEARVIPRSEADATAATYLKDHPRCLAFRNSNLLAPKVFDFMAYLKSDRMALFDSDLMFFSEPTVFLQRLADTDYRKNTLNSDVSSSYTTDPETVHRALGFDLQPKINSGFGLVHRGSMRLDWIEEFLGLPGILEGHFWRIEQTVYALSSSRFGFEMLPSEYTLYFEPGLGERCFRHYNGRIRSLMYTEGMRILASRGLLN